MDNNPPSHWDKSLQSSIKPLAPLNIPLLPKELCYTQSQATLPPRVQRASTSSYWSNHVYPPSINFGGNDSFKEDAYPLATQYNYMGPTQRVQTALPFQHFSPSPPLNFLASRQNKGPIQTRTVKRRFNSHTTLPPLFNDPPSTERLVEEPAKAVSRPFDSGYSNMSSHTSSQSAPQVSGQLKNAFMAKIQKVFPGISETALEEIFAKKETKISNEGFFAAVQESIEDILAQPSYPKRHTKRKRPWDDEPDMPDLKRHKTDPTYHRFGMILLANEFPSVQYSTIRTFLSHHKTLLDTYDALYHLKHPGPNDGLISQHTRLRRPRPQNGIVIPNVIKREFEQIRKIVAEKSAIKKKVEEEKALEEEYRQAGNLVECQCCFVDVTPNRAISCSGNEPHVFCHQCIKKQVETQVMQMYYDIKCIDISGCQARFEKTLLQQVVGEKFLNRVEFLRQMDELTRSGVEGLESCPFCEFKAVCPPPEQDREFSCRNPDCGAISCRLCRQETHTPKTCEEAKNDRAAPERREVEEAMTKALLRTCPKCGVSIVKDDGCNKIRCRCGTLICDVCKKDITKYRYDHFGPGGCPTYEADHGQNRLLNEVERAGQAAVDRILAENEDISREQLHVEASQPPPQQPPNPEELVHDNHPPQLAPNHVPQEVMDMPFPRHRFPWNAPRPNGTLNFEPWDRHNYFL